mmetsp:Transcript_11437/g.23216  ORF Transcript_11437/g.23216 Transcript_11437/m.23216 type:complete len:159 (+) Transcript_11437:505-981(+)
MMAAGGAQTPRVNERMMTKGIRTDGHTGRVAVEGVNRERVEGAQAHRRTPEWAREALTQLDGEGDREAIGDTRSRPNSQDEHEGGDRRLADGGVSRARSGEPDLARKPASLAVCHGRARLSKKTAVRGGAAGQWTERRRGLLLDGAGARLQSEATGRG